MPQAHRLTRLHYTHRYSSGSIKPILQAGQPWGCGSTFAGTTEILTLQNPACFWDPLYYLHIAHWRRRGDIFLRGRRKDERRFLWWMLRLSGALSLFPHTPSCSLQTQLYLSLCPVKLRKSKTHLNKTVPYTLYPAHCSLGFLCTIGRLF